jgi:hypothetical protein
MEILLARTNFQNKNLPTKFETPPKTEIKDTVLYVRICLEFEEKSFYFSFDKIKFDFIT